MKIFVKYVNAHQKASSIEEMGKLYTVYECPSPYRHDHSSAYSMNLHAKCHGNRDRGHAQVQHELALTKKTKQANCRLTCQ